MNKSIELTLLVLLWPDCGLETSYTFNRFIAQFNIITWIELEHNFEVQSFYNVMYTNTGAIKSWEIHILIHAPSITQNIQGNQSKYHILSPSVFASECTLYKYWLLRGAQLKL